MTPRRPTIPAFDDIPSGKPSGAPFGLSEPLRSPRTAEEEPAGAIAHLEPEAGALDALRRRSELIRAGMADARARGVHLGRIGFGAEVAAAVRREAGTGASARMVAARLGISVTTVRRILRGRR